jgi:flagellar biosynthesis/type III secretory pathway protein FliH
MSSKLHRGSMPLEAIAWPSADSGDRGEACPAAGGSALSSAARSARFASDPEQRTRAAYQQGLEEGQAAARQAMTVQIEQMNGRLARTIEELSGLRQRFRHEAEEDVVALALAIARRVLHRELTMSPEALLGLVKAALEKI